MTNKALKFYNVRLRRSVTTDDYIVKRVNTKRGVRTFAIAEFKGTKMYRILG